MSAVLPVALGFVVILRKRYMAEIYTEEIVARIIRIREEDTGICPVCGREEKLIVIFAPSDQNIYHRPLGDYFCVTCGGRILSKLKRKSNEQQA